MLSDVVDNQGAVIGQMFLCPGCKNFHVVHVAPHKNVAGASWSYNGDKQKPTFSPSLLSKEAGHVCHSFVRNGKIAFLPDCTHDLAGQTVALAVALA